MIQQTALSLAVLASTLSIPTYDYTITNEAIYAPTPRITQEMRDMSKDDIKLAISEIWGKDANIGIAIASCESGLRQFNKDGTILRGHQVREDSGVFQINTNYHESQYMEKGMDIFTPKGNIEYAYHLFEKSGTQPWGASRPCWKKIIPSVKT